MNQKISGMEMIIVAVMAMLALIVIYAAGTRLPAPALPSIESNRPVFSRGVEKSEAPVVGSTASEGTERYRTVVINPRTGARLFEWQAPSVSSKETAAAPETAVAENQDQYRTVVDHPETGARLFEWQAPSVSHRQTAAAPEANIAAGEGQSEYRTVVVNPETGARLFEWLAPGVSSVEMAEAPAAR